MVEIRVFVRVQPHHVDDRGGQARDQDGGARGHGGATVTLQAARAIHAPARPPSTASGGVKNTKWRMPLYMAGRVATVTRTGSEAASTTAKSAARRPADAPDRPGLPRAAATIAPTDSAEAQRQHQFGQLQRRKRRHITARHVGNRDQPAVEQLAPRLFEEVGKIFDGAKGIERRDDATRARRGP